MFGFSTIKLVIIGLALAFVLGLMGYVHILRADNKALTSENTRLVSIAKEKQDALQACSDGTQALVDAEAAKTKAAQEALDKAKKDAAKDKKDAIDLMLRKAKDPIVTKDNANDFGGVDKSTQLKDYLSTHDLINEEIDKRNAK